MPKNHPHHHQKTFPWHGAVGVLVLLMAVVVIMVARPTKTDQDQATTNKNSDVPALTITTADGIRLEAEASWPVRNVTVPAVILIHQFGADHHQWDPYISAFTEAGIGVIAYDVRGFGGSAVPEVSGSRETFLLSMSKDVPAVVEYLKSQPFVNQEKISIVGASLGANIAFVAAGSNLGIHKTVLLSPGDFQSALQPKDIPQVHPSNVYGIADGADQTNLNKIMSQASEPKRSDLMADVGHGVEILKDRGVLTGIIDWLKE